MAGYTERLENRGLDGLALRIAGCLAMAWGAAQQILPQSSVDWATYMLWFSYTIFAFLLAEGVRRSTDKGLYFRRLLVFAVISEFPYDLLFNDSLWDTSSQNVMFTLLAGFIVLCAAEAVKKRFDNMILTLLTLVILGAGFTYVTWRFNCEMGLYGILLIVFFYISLNVTYTRLMELIFFVVFLLYVAADNYFNILVNDLYYSFPDKSFALLAVILTWLYNGKRGPNSIAVKTAFYLFHPVMLLVIWAVGRSLR